MFLNHLPAFISFEQFIKSQVTNNRWGTSFKFNINGEAARYKLARKKLDKNTWHIYAGEDRVCTLTFSALMDIKTYLYKAPYPKKSEPTDFSNMVSRVRSTVEHEPVRRYARKLILKKILGRCS